jgi:opacity protein-like surface antigen
MKKKILLLGVFILGMASNSLIAQNEGGFYVSLVSGYAFESSKGEGVFVGNTTEITQGVFKNEVVDYSLGKGINIGVAIGYMFNKNIGTEIAINYLKGGKTQGLNRSLDNTFEENSIAASLLQINPKIVLALGYEKINPYSKFGLVIGLNPSVVLTQNGQFFEDNITNKTELVTEFNGGQSIGFNAASGLMFNISDNFGLFGELNLTSLTYSPTKGTIKKAILNGINQLPQIPENEKNIKFLDEYTTSNTIDRSNEVRRFALPFGSLALNIGAKYSF